MSRNEKKFADAMRELDEIVEQMESGNLPLEEMVDAYRRGAKLVRYCRDKLSVAQTEIKRLEEEELNQLDDAHDGGKN